MTARGRADVSRAGAVLNADRIDYDPASQWLLATGDGRNAATFSDPTGADSGSADQILWNTQTWHVKMKNTNSRSGGR